MHCHRVTMMATILLKILNLIQMTNTTAMTNTELIVMLSELNQDSNIFTFCKNLMESLRDGVITSTQYNDLQNAFETICKIKNLNTAI